VGQPDLRMLVPHWTVYRTARLRSMPSDIVPEASSGARTWPDGGVTGSPCMIGCRL